MGRVLSRPLNYICWNGISLAYATQEAQNVEPLGLGSAVSSKPDSKNIRSNDTLDGRTSIHWQRLWLNEIAWRNIELASSTLDSFHCDKSLLNEVAPANWNNENDLMII